MLLGVALRSRLSRVQILVSTASARIRLSRSASPTRRLAMASTGITTTDKASRTRPTLEVSGASPRSGLGQPVERLAAHGPGRHQPAVG